MKRAISAALLLCFLPLWGEVYWLGPRRGGKSTLEERLEGLLPGVSQTLYTRQINVNNFKSTLKVSAVKGDLEEILIRLKKLKVDKLNLSGGTVRFEIKLPGNMIERYLLIASRKGRPLSCFRMTVPQKLPAPGDWPRLLPTLPGGARITAITELGKGIICGEFQDASEPAYVLFRRADAELRARKYFSAGNEISRPDGGRGDIYFNDRSIIWINFDNNGRGTFFHRPRSENASSL